MKLNHTSLLKILLGSALALVLTFVSGCKTTSSSSDQMDPMKGGEHQQMLNK